MSITRDQLSSFLDNQKVLQERTVGGLKEIVDEYPYFQSAHLLYLYNLTAQKNFRAASQLKQCALVATDRAVLYRLLQPLLTEENADDQPADAQEATTAVLPDPMPVAASKPAVSEPANDELLELEEYDELLRELQSPEASAEEMTPRNGITTAQIDDFPIELLLEATTFADNELQQTSEEPNEELTDAEKAKKLDLIEKFIKENPTIQKVTVTNGPSTTAPVRDEENQEVPDEFITETLSRIYLKQGHYQKAIDSFKRLSLKFPEKSVYFAQQIEEIKKLIN